jgi:hypothetical protein
MGKGLEGKLKENKLFVRFTQSCVCLNCICLVQDGSM